VNTLGGRKYGANKTTALHSEVFCSDRSAKTCGRKVRMSAATCRAPASSCGGARAL